MGNAASLQMHFGCIKKAQKTFLVVAWLHVSFSWTTCTILKLLKWLALLF